MEGGEITRPIDEPGDQYEIKFGSLENEEGRLLLEPFVNDLEVGDVLLTRPAAGTPAWALAFQAPYIFHVEHRRWNHVALYIGGNLIIEKKAWPFWRFDTLDNYCASRRVRVRRYIHGLSTEEKFKLLRRAITLFKVPYNLFKFFEMGASSFFGGIRHFLRQVAMRFNLDWFGVKHRDELIGGGMICTDLLEQCFRAALEDHVVPRDLWPDIEYRLIPAAVSWSPNLEDVKVTHYVVANSADDSDEEGASA